MSLIFVSSNRILDTGRTQISVYDGNAFSKAMCVSSKAETLFFGKNATYSGADIPSLQSSIQHLALSKSSASLRTAVFVILLLERVQSSYAGRCNGDTTGFFR